jgi:hypothetical protein
MKGIVDPIPLRLWNWGIKHRTGALRTLPIELVRMHCLSKGTARVTPEGIVFEGKSYECERSIAEGWQTRARLRGTWKIDVLFDERNLASIYFRRESQSSNSAGPHLETCWRIRATGERVDISLDDLRRERRTHSARLEDLRQDHPQKAAKFNARINAVVGAAQKNTEQVRSGKKQSREGMRERQKEALREEWKNITPLVEARGDVIPFPLNESPPSPGDELRAESSSDYDFIMKNVGTTFQQLRGETDERS